MMDGMSESEQIVSIEQPAPAPEPAPATPSDEIRAVAEHRQHAWEIRSVDYNVSVLCWRRSDIAKTFDREFKRRRLISARIAMPLSPAEPKYLELWNANPGAETQTLGRVVVRVIDDSPDEKGHQPIAS
jgi:hypothetical protein